MHTATTQQNTYRSARPAFSAIKIEHIETTLKEILEANRIAINQLLASQTSPTWDSLIKPLNELDTTLHNMWSPVAHLHAVMESDTLRTVHNNCLPLLTEYHTFIMQNEKLYAATKQLAESAEFATLSPAQQKTLQNTLRDFQLAGIHLPAAKKVRFAEIQQELSKLCTRFAENILDATHAFSIEISDIQQLDGLPEETIKLAEQYARERGKTGWLLTLDFPCYSAAIKYLNHRELRKNLYTAFVTRASETGPDAGKFDNTQIMEDILALRHELATLVGYPDFASYALATRMAKTPAQVIEFLEKLCSKAKPVAEAEFNTLCKFATSLGHTGPLEAWDIPFYSEKLRISEFDISTETLRPWFPAEKAVNGMFAVMTKIFGITLQEIKNADTWHPDVRLFEVRDSHNTLRGWLYTDLYARPHKREGAWMDECRQRQRLADGALQLPVAFLTCNFTPPVGDTPSLLTHDEVETLFHETGHCLHHLMTEVEVSDVAGINGVAWDAVEFPSQLMERWCWNLQALALVSSHEKTGEPLPEALFQKLLAARNFQAGLQMLRQLEFSLFDFSLHLEFDPAKKNQVQAVLNQIRKKVSVIPAPAFNRFQHSFSHIFAGGYAAGYYSYKWAEVLASDAFSLFAEKGIFDRNTGTAFLQTVLGQGGTEEPMTLFVKFRGREPEVDALLKEYGMATTAGLPVSEDH